MVKLRNISGSNSKARAGLMSIRSHFCFTKSSCGSAGASPSKLTDFAAQASLELLLEGESPDEP